MATRKPPAHLSIADLCDELDVARSTFYDWRAKGRAPKCIKLPNGELRITGLSQDEQCRADGQTWTWTLQRWRNRMWPSGSTPLPLGYGCRTASCRWTAATSRARLETWRLGWLLTE